MQEALSTAAAVSSDEFLLRKGRKRNGFGLEERLDIRYLPEK